MAVSSDGILLLVHLPHALKPASTVRLSLRLRVLCNNYLFLNQERLTESLVGFVGDIGGKLPKCAGADATQDAPSSYKEVAGQIAGIFKLVKGWHVIGHKVHYISIFF